MEKFEAWIFDAYPEQNGIRVWTIDKEGRSASFLDPWRPRFLIEGQGNCLAAVLKFLSKKPFPVEVRPTEGRDFFSGNSYPVIEARLPPLQYDSTVKQIKDSGVTLYNADIHLVQAFHYERGHFPLARCHFEVEDGILKKWALNDDPWTLDYDLPPFKFLHLFLTGSDISGRTDPNHAPKGNLAVKWDNTVYELEGSTEDQLETLNHHLNEWNPDIITSDYGDSYLLPTLALACNRIGRKLNLSRDKVRDMAGRGSRSFYTYGRTVYQSGSKYLFGRWHLDTKNSFFLKECSLDGLLEIARVAKIPVQRAARCTIGTSLSSMQLDYAYKQGYLVPMEKQQVEDFRPASELIIADKGGLVYQPVPSWHENVVEYDFTSMYPQIMVQNNISPETVNCSCCRHNVVPEISHNLCQKRRGLVPEVLAPILIKRAEYKRRAKTDSPFKDTYKRRATAFKWCLVTCFGYLGFKNARFGKIEAHECVTAWGREVLLRAKDEAESRGFHVLHALVDSLWIQGKPGMDIEGLRQQIETASGCPVGLEGVYKWLRYCPSKVDPDSGVPNRYFGCFSNGELKVRGLALRRRDTPLLFKNMQNEMLSLLTKADNMKECRSIAEDLREIVEDYRLRLKEGRVTAPELSILFNLSKTPEEYVHDTLSSLAAKQLAAAGIELHAGEAVQYVIVSAKDKVKDWRVMALPLMDGALEYDIKKYSELLDRAEKEILDGLVKPKPAFPIPFSKAYHSLRPNHNQLVLPLEI